MINALRRNSIGSPASSGKWQATYWPPTAVESATARSCGSSSAHRSCARGQRVRKRQPDGGLVGDGISPPSTSLVVVRAPLPRGRGSGSGIAASSAAVYGCAGRA